MDEQLELFKSEEKVINFPNSKPSIEANFKAAQPENFFTYDEFNYANGAKVTLTAPSGEQLDLHTAIFLLEHTKHYLFRNFG